MKKHLLTTSLFTVVVAAAAVAVVFQRQARAELRAEADELRRSNAALAGVRTENERLKAPTPPPPSPTAPSQAELAPVATPAPAAENRDPTQGMVAAEHLRDAGHATADTAFQTLVWAALKGHDEVLAGSLSMSEASRAKLSAVLARMDATLRKKYPQPASIPAQLLAEEILEKTLQLHIGKVEPTADDAATITTRITTRTGRVRSQPFAMRRVDGKWTLALGDQMIDSMIQSLSRPRP
jgi:hypothetical protein